jgi:hypothetical protein
MTTQMLIYETVVPLSASRHRDCSVDVLANYSFSAKVNSVPLMAVEFQTAAAEYAIVFTGDENILPAVILGMRRDENLYVSANDATWGAKYKPAFVRRYPFVFSTTPDKERFVLCIDEAFSGFNRESRGQNLFDADGKPTAYVDNILKFLQEYQVQFRRTQEFCKKVRELDLLEPMQAQVEMRSGERLSLNGFMAVNRAKLKALPADKLSELAKTDELELLYLHLQSMRNFNGMSDRLAEHIEKPAPVAEAAEEETLSRAKSVGGNGASHPNPA